MKDSQAPGEGAVVNDKQPTGAASAGRTRQTDLQYIRRLLQMSRPYWLQMAGVLALGLLQTPLALLTPLPVKIGVDSVLGSHPLPRFLDSIVPAFLKQSGMERLGLAVAMLVIVTLLIYAASLGSWWLATYTGEKLVLEFRSRLFRHVQRLSLSYHDTKGTTDSTYRIQYDAQSIQVIIVGGVPLLSSGFTLIAMIAVTASMDWQLALIALSVSPVLYFLTESFRRRIRDRWSEVKNLDSSAMSLIQEVLSAVRVVKAFGREDREHERFRRTSDERVQGQVDLALLNGQYDLYVGLTIAIGSALVLCFGILHVKAGALTLGSLLLVMSYLAQLYEPLKTISKKLAELQSGIAGAQRAFSLLDESPEVEDRSGGRRLARAKGAIGFRNVRFSYNAGSPVLEDISFDAPAGARVGIQGRTGAGKSTLISLLMRFYDPDSGQILLDGCDLRNYKLADLRKQFAMVLQEPVLFSTSIAENIAYARPEATRDQIVDAARKANAHDFIAHLPDDYGTHVGERGMKLSGGERQRISLARAFLKDAPVLILDEPTSSVDVKTEAAIMDAIERLMHGRTTFIIAHRLSTLEGCDLRLEMEAGHLTVRPGARAADPPEEALLQGKEGGGIRSDVTLCGVGSALKSVMGRRRIVVVGTMATHPYAGMAWMHMQIAGGLMKLGHEVYYIEATSTWPYDPIRRTKANDSEYAVPYVAKVAESFGLTGHWGYRRSYADDEWFGLSRQTAEDVLAHSDVVFNVSGATALRGREKLKVTNLICLGTDPVYHEIGFAQGNPISRQMVEQHDWFVTYGENIGNPDCAVPPFPRLKARTRQPVLLDLWTGGPPVRQEFTTVCNWRQNGHDIEFQGDTYYWSKHREFLNFIDLPLRSGYPLELAMGLGDANDTQPGLGEVIPAAGMTAEERRLLDANRWRLANAHAFTMDPWSYRDYIRSSRGEFSVAKDQNVRLRSGWFSERSACYLAAGRPVVTQDTGFGNVLPTGEGLCAFTTTEEAVEALNSINSDYEKHSRAARRIAEEYFRAETVLAKLLRDLGV